MAEFYEALLPSGRAIRIERLYTRDYREAMKRAGARGASSQFNYQADLAHEILLASLRALTAAPAELQFKQAEDGAAPGAKGPLDIDATLDKVPPAAWVPCTYEALVTKGPASLYEQLKDVGDYEAATLFAQQVVAPISPLGVVVAGKMRARQTA